jgi:feruloyl-CoA synthase
VAGISALAPLVQDIVVAGHGGDEVRFLLIPNIEACRIAAGAAAGTATQDILQNEKVRAAVAEGLASLKTSGVGSSAYATRALFLVEPPSVDGGEITDKGYINQRAMLARRTIDLAKLNGDDGAVWIGLATSQTAARF